jgi:LysM repeat protein
MKKFILLACLLCGFFFSFSQSELLVQRNEKGLFLNHSVAAKESFYSIGRLYNLPPKDIASFNSLDMNNGLQIGQVIRIPLNAANFSQSAANGRAVYYMVGEKEGLFRVSQNNNNVLMADLRKWNKLSDDKINQGKKLIVGYLVSAEAANIVAAAPVEKTPETPKETRPAEPIKEAAAIQKPVAEKKTEPPVVKQVASSQVAVNDTNGGYFKSLFDQQVKTQPVSSNETAIGGIFKTASGWQDAKYYVLMDKVESGTIVRLTNPSNNKMVYAKVLGEMSGIRQNQGYDLRMSNAAASALAVSDEEKFIIRVSY